jgi:uncharacterized protein (TIGR02147 family)
MNESTLNSLSLLSFCDYKTCLKALLTDLEEQDCTGQRSALARAMGCQPAYLSRVLNGEGELSFEQMEAACRFFVLKPSEAHFLISLLGENRAGTQQMKSFWREHIRAARKEHQELKGRLGLRDSLSDGEILTYYGSWHHSAIHIAASITELQTVSALSEYLSLSEEIVRASLDFLMCVGLVEKKANRYVTSERNIHLERNHSMVEKHHINWKLKSIEAVNKPGAEAIRYTGVMTLSYADAERIKELILDAVERARQIVRESPEEILGCYSFEFFEVGKSRRSARGD